METNHKIFKPFDKVLVRVRIDAPLIWTCTFYSHLDKDDCHVTIGGQIFDDKDILRYEGNEHLVGTTDEPEEEEVKLEEGECVMVCDDISILPEEWRIRKYDRYCGGGIRVFNNVSADIGAWNYAIRFSDFNPNDMEETKKHILCVKDGRVIRHKG